MKAAVIRNHGGVEQIHVQEVPDPSPQRGEVLVEVKAASLNHLDIWVRRGGRTETAMPHVLGSDCSGVIRALGEGVHGRAVGDEIVLNPGLSCGCCDSCLGGQQSLCASFGIVGLNRWGTFAQYLAAPAYNVMPKPAHLDFTQAAALTLAHLTAWRMLITRSHLILGHSVLIHGIGGGVALAALQLSKLAGARAIVTSSSDDKLAKARALGADLALNYRQQDVAAAARQFTGGNGVDVVIDSVGAATLPTSLAAVRRNGVIMNCGVTGGADAKLDMQQLYWRQVNLLGSTLGSFRDMRKLLAAVNANRMTPVIDSVFTLDQVRQATQRMESGDQFGKIVLKLAD